MGRSVPLLPRAGAVSVTILGIRHHGPGSARSVERALAELEPDAVLVEGPPEAEPLLPLASHPDMHPPVALLGYAPDEPGRAAFYPFTCFSPEWRALRYSPHERGRPRRIDPPPPHLLPPPPHPAVPPPGAPRGGRRGAPRGGAGRGGDGGGGGQGGEASGQARREGDAGGAVVGGPGPARGRARLGPASADAALLRGLAKRKVTLTWVPWTYDRLSYRSGYGAGVTSPGWYDHLYRHQGGQAGVRWLAKTARLLREEDIAISSAHVIEAVRLAEALPTLRGRPLAGLPELTETPPAVLGAGADAAPAIVHERLVVGQVLGSVPAEAPTVPLQAELDREQRRLRLRPEAAAPDLDLHLRKPIDRDRSPLLPRLTPPAIRCAQPPERTD